MKKLVMTGLVAAMACGVQAANVYDKDGTKVDLKGDIQIQVRQKVGVDQDPYMDYDDLQVGFDVKHATESGVEGFGTLKMDWKKQADGSAASGVDEAFVGIKMGIVSVAVGRQDWGSDIFEVDRAVEIGDALWAFPAVLGYETVQSVIDLGVAKAILSHDLEVKENSAVSEVYLVTDPKKTFGLEAGVIFQSYETEVVPADEESGDPEIASETIDTVGVRAVYSIEKFAIGADYSSNDDKSVMNGMLAFPIIGATQGVVGYSLLSPDEGDDVGTWYANVRHHFSKSLNVFAEVGDDDKEDTDLGWLAGFQAKF